MKNELKRMLAGFLAALMLLTAVPAVKADFSINASAVEYCETAADEETVIAANDAEEAEEEEEKPVAQNSFLTTIINFFKDFVAVIREAIEFLRQYGLIEDKKA